MYHRVTERWRTLLIHTSNIGFHRWVPEHGSDIVAITSAKGGGFAARQEFDRALDERSWEHCVMDLDPTMRAEMLACQCGKRLRELGREPRAVQDYFR